MSNKIPYTCADFRCGWIVRRKKFPDNTILVLQVTSERVWFCNDVGWTPAMIAQNADFLEISKDGGNTWFEPYHLET